jgi:hypothetical protein
MDTETFHIDWLRTPFIVMYLALLAWVLFLSLEGGTLGLPTIFIVALTPVVLAAVMGRYLFVVQIGPQGISLNRVYRVRWAEVTKAKEVSFFGLPYLLIWRVSRFFPLWVPLYVRGSHSLISRLQAWCPSEGPIASTLSQLSKSNSPHGSQV